MATGDRRADRCPQSSSEHKSTAVHIRNRSANHRAPSDQLKIPAAREVRNPNHSPPPQTEPPHHPWLLFCRDRGYKRQTFWSPDGRSRHRRSIPELPNKRVEFCGYGWLVLLDHNREEKDSYDYSLWNLSTFESISLPPLKLNPSFTVHFSILTSAPGTTRAMLCLFEYNSPSIMFFGLCGRGKEWTEIRFENQLIDLGLLEADSENKSFFISAACCNGVVYVTNNYNDLLTICINEEEGDCEKFVLKPFNMIVEEGEDWEAHFICGHVSLVGCGEELFRIVIYMGGIQFEEIIAIEVFRLNFDLRKWEKVVTSKDHTFFFGGYVGYGTLACPASSEAEGGRLYLAIDGDRNIFSYDIEHKRLSVAYCFPKRPSPRSTPTWVMPNYRFTDDVKSMKDVIQKEEAGKEEGEVVLEPIVNTGVEEETNLLRLPKDIIELIARHLSILAYMNFRAVCKAFYSAAPVSEWQKASFGTDSLSPWLVFPEKEREVLNFVEPEFNGRYLVSTPKESEGGRIYYSKDGLLLMSTDDIPMFFFNPFTREVLPCPNLSPRFEMYSFLFSSPPSSSECVIVGISHDFPIVGMHILHFGSSEDWFYTEVATGSRFRANRNTPVFWNGGFYFLGQEGNLLCIKADPFSYEFLEKPQSPCKSFHQNFLVECDEELLSVFVGVAGKWIRIFRLDRSRLAWEETKTLGKHTLYLSRSSAIAIVSKCRKMENRIYFPRLHGESMVFYSLNTRKFHSSQGDYSWMDYVGTSEQLLCGWIEPRWSKISSADQ